MGICIMCQIFCELQKFFHLGEPMILHNTVFGKTGVDKWVFEDQ